MTPQPAARRPLHIAPSILAADLTRLGDQVRAAQAAGASCIHIDVMDGRFVPNLSFGVPIVAAVRSITTLPLDVHLMIVEPDHLLADFASAGASRLTVHVEAVPHLHRTLQAVAALGCTAGVALNPHTPLVAVSEILHMVDLVLIMTVNPGFGGQHFIAETLPKISALRALLDERGLSAHIQVDGGVNADTAARVVAAGADHLVAGSAVFNASHTVAAGIDALRAALPGMR